MWKYIIGGLIFIFVIYVIFKPKKEDSGYGNVSMDSSNNMWEKVKNACCIRSR